MTLLFNELQIQYCNILQKHFEIFVQSLQLFICLAKTRITSSLQKSLLLSKTYLPLTMKVARGHYKYYSNFRLTKCRSTRNL